MRKHAVLYDTYSERFAVIALDPDEGPWFVLTWAPDEDLARTLMRGMEAGS